MLNNLSGGGDNGGGTGLLADEVVGASTAGVAVGRDVAEASRAEAVRRVSNCCSPMFIKHGYWV